MFPFLPHSARVPHFRFSLLRPHIPKRLSSKKTDAKMAARETLASKKLRWSQVSAMVGRSLLISFEERTKDPFRRSRFYGDEPLGKTKILLTHQDQDQDQDQEHLQFARTVEAGKEALSFPSPAFWRWPSRVVAAAFLEIFLLPLVESEMSKKKPVCGLSRHPGRRSHHPRRLPKREEEDPSGKLEQASREHFFPFSRRGKWGNSSSSTPARSPSFGNSITFIIRRKAKSAERKVPLSILADTSSCLVWSGRRRLTHRRIPRRVLRRCRRRSRPPCRTSRRPARSGRWRRRTRGCCRAAGLPSKKEIKGSLSSRLRPSGFRAPALPPLPFSYRKKVAD